jgi:DNA polymerase III epsilon subunit-like protein
LQLTANLALLINPFLPSTAKKMCSMLKVVDKMLDWENAGSMKLLSVGYSLREPQLLFRKIEDEEIAYQMDKLRAGAIAAAEETKPAEETVHALKEEGRVRVDAGTVSALREGGRSLLPVGAVSVYDGLEDPGRPLSEEVRLITGLSDDELKGQRLDDARVAGLLAGADLVLAHNAAFDRPFCEARYPGFAAIDWACSLSDIDWKKEGRGSGKLEHLALHQGVFYQAHRAEIDCHALLAVLCASLASDGQTGLARLLAAGATPSYRLMATQAPFEAKDALKARGYRWDTDWDLWTNDKDEELRWATTPHGHYLYVA